VITNGVLLKSPRPNYNAQLTVRADGSMSIGQQTYTGTITDGTATTTLASVNVINDVTAGGITRITPPSAPPVHCRPPRSSSPVIRSLPASSSTRSRPV
jgi:hypothetical protein